jgi:hypothetical protein
MPEREPLQRVHRAAKNQTTARKGPCPCPTRSPRPMRKQRVRSFVCGAVTWLMLYSHLAVSLVSQVLCNMAGLPCAAHEKVVTLQANEVTPAVNSEVPSPANPTEETILPASSLQEGAEEGRLQQTDPVATPGTCHLDVFGHARPPGTRRLLLSSVVACARFNSLHANPAPSECDSSTSPCHSACFVAFLCRQRERLRGRWPVERGAVSCSRRSRGCRADAT